MLFPGEGGGEEGGGTPIYLICVKVYVTACWLYVIIFVLPNVLAPAVSSSSSSNLIITLSLRGVSALQLETYLSSNCAIFRSIVNLRKHPVSVSSSFSNQNFEKSVRCTPYRAVRLEESSVTERQMKFGRDTNLLSALGVRFRECSRELTVILGKGPTASPAGISGRSMLFCYQQFPLAPVSRPPHDLPMGLRGCTYTNFVSDCRLRNTMFCCL